MILFRSTTLSISDIKANICWLLIKERATGAEIYSSSHELTWQFSMLNRPFAGSLEYQHWVLCIIHSSEHTFSAKRKGK